MVKTPIRPPAAATDLTDARKSKRPQSPTPTTSTAEKLSPVVRFWHFLEGRNSSLKSSYYLILGTTLALVVIGLIMVFSASAVEETAKSQDPFGQGIKQSIFAALGLVALFLLSRVSVVWLKRLAWPLMIFSLLTLVAVLLIGSSVGGNKNWIQFGSFSFQPSELAKLAIILWIAAIYARKQSLLNSWRHLLIPVVPGAALVVFLVFLEHDLGTTVIVLVIAAACLYFAGIPARVFVVGGAIGLAAAVFTALSSSNRSGRLGAWLGKCSEGEDAHGFCDQARDGMYALASGRWFGVGLGQSRQKWNWLPEAHNDFIFAIIGEELGLIGTLTLVALYLLLAIGMFRVIVRQNDLFVRIVCGAITIWIVGQAFVNIAMVIGVLPVIGVPLPFVSYGGTALTACMAAIGVVLGFARKDMYGDQIESQDNSTSSSKALQGARP